MIKEVKPISVVQSREVTPLYADPNDPNYHESWGRPIDMKPSDHTELSMVIHVKYDSSSAELVQRLLEAAWDIMHEIQGGV